MIKKARSYYTKSISMPLYKNSFFLILSYLSLSLSGFIFWLASAKIYTTDEVGIATALYSSMTLIMLLSRFGLEQSLIRFFPEKNVHNVLFTAMCVSTFFSVLFGLIYIMTIDIFSPELQVIKDYTHLFLLFIAASSFANIAGVAFLALRKAEYYLMQTMIISFKVVIVIFLVPFGSMGIIYAIGIAFILATLVSTHSLYHCGLRIGKIDTDFLKNSFRFSLGSYFSGFFTTGPGLILPLLILPILGSTPTALYYVAYSIASLLFMISTAISNILFVEGSCGEDINKTVLRSAILQIIVLIPAIVFLLLFGEAILGFFGAEYIQGQNLLYLLVGSSFFVSICYHYFAIEKIKKDIGKLVLSSGATFLLLILLGWILMHHYGILGIGYAWLLSYGTVAMLILVFSFIKNKAKFTMGFKQHMVKL